MPYRDLTTSLEVLWDEIAVSHTELPAYARVALSPTPTSPDHGPERWSLEDDGTLAGLVVSSDVLTTGSDATLTYLLHEAAHVLNWRQRVKDVSSGGLYHNQNFMVAAETMGLEWPANTPPMAGRGKASPRLSTSTADRWREARSSLAPAIEAALPYLVAPEPARPRPARLNIECGCAPPRKLRASRAQLDRGPVVCGVCRKPFIPVDE